MRRVVLLSMLFAFTMVVTGCANRTDLLAANMFCADNQEKALESFQQKRIADIFNYEESVSKVKTLEHLYIKSENSCKYFIVESFPHNNTYTIDYYIYNYTNGIVEVHLDDCISYRIYGADTVKDMAADRNSSLKEIRRMGFKYSDDYGLNGVTDGGYQK